MRLLSGLKGPTIKDHITIQKYRLFSSIIENLTLQVININYLIMFHCDKQKYFFSACIVNIWNSLPNSVVVADTICLSKAPLDKF